MNKKDYPIILTVKHMQEILGIGKHSAYDLMKREDFPSFKVGKQLRVERDKFFEWMEQEVS